MLGSDGTGTAGLTYTWTAAGPGTVTYSANGTTAASKSVATFSVPGSYTFTATISNVAGLSTTSTVNVNVLPLWLSTTSLATWNPSAHILTVTGPTTLTTDPGTDESII